MMKSEVDGLRDRLRVLVRDLDPLAVRADDVVHAWQVVLACGGVGPRLTSSFSIDRFAVVRE